MSNTLRASRSRTDSQLPKMSPNKLASLAPGDRWMTFREVLDYLPTKPAKGTLYRLTQQGKIPHYKAPHGTQKLLFVKSEVDRWLKGEVFESKADREGGRKS